MEICTMNFDDLQSRLNIVLERARHLTQKVETIQANINDYQQPEFEEQTVQLAEEERATNLRDSITDDFTSIRDDSQAISTTVDDIDLDAILNSINLGDSGISL